MQSLVHVVEWLTAQPRFSLLQQPLSRVELRIGNALRFMSFTVTANLHAQKLRGGFNLLHGSHAMAFVIMVGVLQRGVSLDQQTRSRCRSGHQTLAEGKSKADNGKTDEGAAKVSSHILLMFVLIPDFPPPRAVTQTFYRKAF